MTLSKKHYKAQASFEFFMTYGWIFLVTIIVISVLIYSDIFNVALYSLSQECEIYDQFDCLASTWHDSGNIILSLRSISPANIYIKNITLIPEQTNQPVSLFNISFGECRKDNQTGEFCDTDILAQSTEFPTASKRIFTLEPFGTYLEGRKNFKARIIINYYFNGSDPNKDLRTTMGRLKISR